jgi:hypothetical protein
LFDCYRTRVFIPLPARGLAVPDRRPRPCKEECINADDRCPSTKPGCVERLVHFRTLSALAAAAGKMAARSTSTVTKLFERFYHDVSLYDKFFHKHMNKGQYIAA